MHKEHKTSKFEKFKDEVPFFTITPPSVATTPNEGPSNLASFVENKILVRSSQSEVKLSISKEDVTPSTDLLSPISKEITAIEMPYPPYASDLDTPVIPLLYIRSDEDTAPTRGQELKSIFCNQIEAPKSSPIPYLEDFAISKVIQNTETSRKDLTQYKQMTPFEVLLLNENSLNTSAMMLPENSLNIDHLQGGCGNHSRVIESDSNRVSISHRLRQRLKLRMPSHHSESSVDNRRSSLLSVSIPLSSSRRPSMTSLLSLTPSMGRRFSFMGAQQKVSEIVWCLSAVEH